MAIRNAQDPYGGRTGLVDKLIGNAFDVVHVVARHINEIKYIVANMEAVVTVAQNLPDTSNITRNITMGSRGTISTYDLPTGVTMANLVFSSLLVIDANTNGFQTENAYFRYWYENGKLKLYLASDAPVSMVGAEARWNITYRIL